MLSPAVIAAARPGSAPRQDDTTAPKPADATAAPDGAAGPGTTAAASDASASQAGRPAIRPRKDWGSAAPPSGTLRAIDNQLLVVHHTEAPGKAYEPSAVPGLIEGIYAFHLSLIHI